MSIVPQFQVNFFQVIKAKMNSRHSYFICVLNKPTPIDLFTNVALPRMSLEILSIKVNALFIVSVS